MRACAGFPLARRIDRIGAEWEHLLVGIKRIAEEL